MKQSTVVRAGYVVAAVLAAMSVLTGLLWLLGGPHQAPTPAASGTATSAPGSAEDGPPVDSVTRAIQEMNELQAGMNALTTDVRGFVTTGDRWWLVQWMTQSDQNRSLAEWMPAVELLNLPEEQKQGLATAIQDDEQLRRVDLRAIRLVLEAQGVPESQMPEPVAEYQLIEADAALEATAQRELAVTAVFGQDYRQAAERAQAPIYEFTQNLTQLSNQAPTTGQQAQPAEAAPATPAASTNGVGGEPAAVLGILGTALGAIALVVLMRLLDTRSFQVVRRYAAQLAEASPHDLGLHLEPEGLHEQRVLAEAFNEREQTFTDVLSSLDRDANLLKNTAERLHSHSAAVATSARTTVQSATEAADSAGSVSANVDTVAAGTEEMNASIQEIAGSAARASDVATEGVRAAESAARTVTQLSESSLRIGEIMKTIESIAEQTNLLALNATIEASRAGEAGKGFAVVATEVKNLASQTAAATEDISERVLGIQGDAEATSTALTQISEIIARINETQTTIASAVEEQTATTNEMSRSVQDAAKSARGIAATIHSVANDARSGADSATATDDEVNGLKDLVASMGSAMAPFTTY